MPDHRQPAVMAELGVAGLGPGQVGAGQAGVPQGHRGDAAVRPDVRFEEQVTAGPGEEGEGLPEGRFGVIGATGLGEYQAAEHLGPGRIHAVQTGGRHLRLGQGLRQSTAQHVEPAKAQRDLGPHPAVVGVVGEAGGPPQVAGRGRQRPSDVAAIPLARATTAATSASSRPASRSRASRSAADGSV